MSQLSAAIATLKDTSMRLHAVADEVSEPSLALTLRERARDHERAVEVVEAHLKIVLDGRTKMEIH